MIPRAPLNYLRSARPGVALLAASILLTTARPAVAQDVPRPDARNSTADSEAPAEAMAQAHALEQAITSVIARAERSVVAVARAIKPDIPEPRARPRVRQQANGANPLNQLLLNAAQEVQPQTHGAGVVIDASGLVLTQYLVVEPGAEHWIIDTRGRRHRAVILAADPRSGLAVLRFEPSEHGEPTLEALEIGEAELLEKGRFVVSIGNPFAIQSDAQPTASWGVVSNTARKAPPGENLNNVKDTEGNYRTTLSHFGALIQTDARLGWNAGGGALVTLDGKLVGVTTTTATIAGHERPAGYAIPLNRVMRRVLEELREGREPEYGLLGLTFNRLPITSPITGETGIAVTSAYAGSPAANAGLTGNDLILRVSGQPTFDADSLQLAVSSLPPGSGALVEFERSGQLQETTVLLGKAFVEGRKVVSRKPPAWRGMRVDYVTAAPGPVLSERARSGHLDAQGCVLVSEVEPNSIAWREIGARPYRYVSHVDGQRVSTPEEFYAAVRGKEGSVSLRFTKPPIGDEGPTPPVAQPIDAFRP